MNHFYAKEYFTQSLEDFAATVAKMRKDLEWYATQPNASQANIDKRNETIARLLTAMGAMEEVVEFYRSEVDRVSQKNAEEYQRGYTAGLARGQGQIRDTLSDADNEKMRELNMKTALRKWADHLT